MSTSRLSAWEFLLRFQKDLRTFCQIVWKVGFFLVALFFSSGALAATVTISTNTTWTAGTSTGDDIIVSGATLTLGAGAYNFNSLTVQSSGIVVGQGNTGAGTGVTITVATDVNVDVTSTINVNGKGYAGGSGTLQSSGSGPNPGTGGYYTAGGGSYGGLGTSGSAGGGGVSSATLYGSATQPVSLGSGGGGTATSGATGGAGGGAIKLIVTGTLTVDGAISANGADSGKFDPSYSAGAGSGGSVWLQVGTLAGSGSIQAKGGNASLASGGNLGGAGGGGRIAVYYSSSSTFSGSVSVSGGTGYTAAAVGSYFEQNSTTGDVNCSVALNSNYDPSASLLISIQNFNVGNSCNWAVLGSTAINISGNLTIASGATLRAYSPAASLSATNKTTQPTTTTGVGAIRLVVTGTSQIDGTLNGAAVWVKTSTLTGSGTISQSSGGAIALYFGAANTFSGTVTISSGSFFLQNYATGDVSCPYGITSYFNPTDALPGYSAALNNVSISGGCKYGFPSQATGTTATLTVPGNMTVASGSFFYGDGMGSAGGVGNGPNSGSGSSPGGGNYYSGAGGSYGGIGAAGNLGGTPGVSTYGSATQPVSLGSGGGGTATSGATGGAGGGAIKLIVTGTLTVDGTISANGADSVKFDPSYSGGAGSGGSVWLQVGTLAGSGSILAKGGSGTAASGGNRGGAGGGGRIAIYYSTNTFAGTISVAGGAGYGSAAAGSYFTQDASGNVNCNSATTTYYDPSSPPAIPINNLNVTNGCTFIVTGGAAVNISGSLTVDSISTLMAATPAASMSSTNKTTQPTTATGVGAIQLVVAGTSQIDGTLNGAAVWVKTSTLAGSGTISQSSGGAIALYYGVANTFSGTVTISSGSFFLQNYATGDVSCPYGITSYFNPADALPGYAAAINNLSITNACKYGFAPLATGTSATLTVPGNMTVASGSFFYADGRGSAGGAGSGQTSGSGSSPGGGSFYTGAGGSYGGIGAAGNQGGTPGVSTYGSVTQPVSLGSGGGGTATSGATGGAGGGAIKLIVTGTLTVDGAISANGADSVKFDPSYSGGAGSGGSVWLQVGTLAGSGSILAKGGSGTAASGGNRGGAGGGGRIAIYYSTNTFAGTISVAGGAGYGSAAAGSYFTQDASGNVNCNSATTTYYDPSSPPAIPINNLNVTNGCTFIVTGGAAVNISGSLTIDSLSTLKAATPAASLLATNKTTQPTTTSGVGAIQVVVAGTSQIDGTLNGAAVWLKTSTLTGSGTISQSSGGAIALYYGVANTFSGTVTISSGSFFLQNYATGDVSCPYGITSYFNPADALPGYAAAINNLSITNACKYGFTPLATGTSATLTIPGDLTIASGAFFYADGRGSSGGGTNSNGGGSGPGTAGTYTGGGGGYGGVGTSGYNGGVGGGTYGSATQPVSLGSGGGGTNSSSGGAGGGAIKLIVTGTLTVDGTISANGVSSVPSGNYYSGGGGSGGSIWLQVGTLAGSGSIQAKGGDGTPAAIAAYKGGGGGGGRIALYFTTNSFTGTVSVAGGAGNTTAAVGTIAGLYPATKLVFSTQPSSTGQVGVNLAQQPIVQALNGPYNSIDVNYSGNVTLTAYTDNTCTTTLLSGATVADSPKAVSSGLATYTGANINKMNNGNPIYLQASSGSLTSACSSAITLSAGPATILVFTQQPSVSNHVGVVFATVPKVAAQDGYGDTNTSYSTNIILAVYSDSSCSTSVAGGTLSGTPATPSSGVATFTGTRYSLANTGAIPNYYFKATSGALTSACSNAFTVSPNAGMFFRGW